MLILAGKNPLQLVEYALFRLLILHLMFSLALHTVTACEMVSRTEDGNKPDMILRGRSQRPC